MRHKDPNAALQFAYQYALELLRSINYDRPVRVTWGDDTTAYTDGLTIYYPREICGFALHNQRMTKKRQWIVKGLTLHEICHFLQDLSKVNAVENETGLNHHFVNIVLDVAGEQKLQKVWPREWRNLVQLRALVRKHHMNDYKAILKTSGLSFFTYAANATLAARFWRKTTPFVWLKKVASAPKIVAIVGKDICWPTYPLFSHPHPTVKFYDSLDDDLKLITNEHDRLETYWRMKKKARETALNDNNDHDLWNRRGRVSADYCKVENQARAALQQGGDMLGSYLWSFAQKWPELCDHNAAKVADPVWGDKPGTFDRNDQSVAQYISSLADKHIAYQYTNSRRYPPQPESIALYNRLQFQLPMIDAVLDIMAPEKLDRRRLVAGDPLPWTMGVEIKEYAKGRQAVLCLDISESMKGQKLKDALIAGQAVTMALESNRVHVVGLLFETYSFTEKHGTSSNLFPDDPTLERIYELNPSPYPSRGGTSFMFLEKLWRQYPDSNIFIVSDGLGAMPENVETFDKDRTTFIQIQGRFDGEKVSNNVIDIVDPMDLAGVVLGVMAK